MNRLIRPKSSAWIVGLLALAITAFTAGCGEDVPQDADVNPTVIVFDPEVPAIPLPSDAALDTTDGTLPDVADPTTNDPQGAFAKYFTALHGWPVTTPISIPVDGKIDPATLSADNLAVFKLNADGSADALTVGSIGFDEQASEIQATVKEPLEFGTKYGFVLSGDIKDTDGNSVVGSQAIFFATFAQPLVDQNGPTVDLLEGEEETAKTLEGLRQLLKPVVDAATSADADLKRGDILSASVWTTTPDPIAILNPATSTLPLPSDAALEEDGTLPNLGAGMPASAQADFYKYLDTLHGWPVETGLDIPLSTPLVADSVTTDAVKLFRFEADGTVTLLDVETVTQGTNASGTAILTIVPEAPLQLATRYGYILTNDVKAEVTIHGQKVVVPVIPDIPLLLGRQTSPLVDANGASVVAQVSDAQAAQLEGVRQLFAPVYAAAEEAGVARDTIVAASFFHTSLDAFAIFDPTTGEVPFPNEFVREGTVNLPLPEGADPLTSGVINELNTRSGFGITSDGWLPVAGAKLDPATINSDTILLARTDASGLPKIYTDARYSLEYKEDWNVIVFGPENSPFDQNEGVFGGDDFVTAGIITTGVKDVNGLDIKPTPAFVFLRSKHPLFDAETGKSLVSQLDDASAEALEDARRSYEELFLAGAVIGHGERKEIANAWAFQTEAATAFQQRMSAKAEALVNEGGSPSAAGDPTTVTNPGGNIGLQQTSAMYTTKFFLDAANGLALMDEPVDQPVPITISVPNAMGACGAGPFPVVIIGHGLGGERANAVGIFADALAADPYCMATVALDFPFHGQRKVQVGGQDVPFMSANVILTKNNFLQSVVDLSVLTEVIKENGLEGVLNSDPSSDLIDETKIGYAGQSLGAILGVNFVATDDDVTVAALNVPGGRLTDVVLGGALGQQILGQLPPSLVPGTFEFFRTFSFLQWIIEPGDPWSFAQHVMTVDEADAIAEQPLFQVIYDLVADTFSLGSQLKSNQVMIQMAGQDATIPNATTELLATAIGVSLDDTTFPDAAHGFISGSDPAGLCAKEQVAVWLTSGFAGTAELGDAQKNACGITTP